jgi:hypothetical protein
MDDCRTTRLLRVQIIAFVIAGVSNAFIGAWAALDSSSFYNSFPGFGQHWVSMMGPYDEHLVIDIGLMFLALSVTLFATLVRPYNVALVRTAALSALTFEVPHLIFHATHLSGFTPAQATAEIASLAIMAAAPAVALAASLLAGRARVTPSPSALGSRR